MLVTLRGPLSATPPPAADQWAVCIKPTLTVGSLHLCTTGPTTGSKPPPSPCSLFAGPSEKGEGYHLARSQAQSGPLSRTTPLSPRGTAREGQGQQSQQHRRTQILPQGGCSNHKGGEGNPLLSPAVAGAAGGGKERGAAAVPHANPVRRAQGRSMQVMQGAQGGAALLQLPSRGASQGDGRGSTVSAGPGGGGGGLQLQLGTMPFAGPVRAPAPLSRGGGGGPAGPGAAVLHHGGSQGPQHSHGRASEGAHSPWRTSFRRVATYPGARGGKGQATGRL